MATLYPPLIAVVGPTAAGKSALALRIARADEGEIVSCDSLQVYRGLDLGSAKATSAERDEVPHHLLDVVDPDQDFSAAEYARLARAAIREITARARLPVVAGGTGLYLRALLHGLFEGPARQSALRERLSGLANRFGDARLHRLLAHVDGEASARIEPRDRVRVVRALEVFFATGRPISSQRRGGAASLQGFDVLTVGLAPDRTTLRERVERRTDAMFAGGLVEEVASLLQRGYPPDLRPLRSIGYRQAVAVARGESSVPEARASIVTETMRYAKRQMTWFRTQAQVEWFEHGEAAFVRARAWLQARSDRALSP